MKTLQWCLPCSKLHSFLMSLTRFQYLKVIKYYVPQSNAFESPSLVRGLRLHGLNHPSSCAWERSNVLNKPPWVQRTRLRLVQVPLQWAAIFTPNRPPETSFDRKCLKRLECFIKSKGVMLLNRPSHGHCRFPSNEGPMLLNRLQCRVYI